MSNVITINDLKDRESSKDDLSPQERLAIKNFDRYRIKTLSEIKNEDLFHQTYQKLQAEANLSDYKTFLDEKYL